MSFCTSNTDNGRSDDDAEVSSEERGSIIMLIRTCFHFWDLFEIIIYMYFSVIKSLRRSENLQVKDKLYKQRNVVVKISSDMCSLCNKKRRLDLLSKQENTGAPCVL
ncbi:hypothetical protein REPUB_Repub10bG0079100 [Reevesia pubescens]